MSKAQETRQDTLNHVPPPSEHLPREIHTNNDHDPRGTLEADDLWQAVTEKRFVPDVVYAVHTTMIYCLSDCPSRRPDRSAVHFFASPGAAETAGYRPCKRCRPEARESERAKLEALLGSLEKELPTPTVGKVAARAGMGLRRFRRVFTREFGLEPALYLKGERSERLKGRLREGAEVTSALYEVGYGSSRALYEAADDLLGMTPGTYRKGGAGMTVRYRTFSTPLGSALIAATERGVCALSLGEGLLEALRAEFPRATLLKDDTALTPFVAAVHAYLAGERVLELPLDVSSTTFQARVWRALQAIPYGETRSYAQIAEAIGDKGAVRAVAGACAKNPVALVVPCHRVVRSDGTLSGYRWGVARKAWLLAAERGVQQEELVP